MTDKAFRNVAPRYAAWETHEQHLGELRRELAEEREVIGIIARERNEARAERDEARAECAGLAMRLEHSEARTEWLRKRLSRWDVWAGVVLAYWNVSGRE